MGSPGARGFCLPWGQYPQPVQVDEGTVTAHGSAAELTVRNRGVTAPEGRAQACDRGGVPPVLIALGFGILGDVGHNTSGGVSAVEFERASIPAVRECLVDPS